MAGNGSTASGNRQEKDASDMSECSLVLNHLGSHTTTVHKQKGEKNMLKLQRIMKFLVCLVLVASFMGCASTRTKESTGEYLDDSTITSKVKSAILMDSSLKVLQINVETFKGVVQLSGFVDSRQSSTKAAEVANSVKGVVSVKNDLVVK
jgi:hypothetical protein